MSMPVWESVALKLADTHQIDDIISSYFEEVMTNDECLNYKFILKVKLKYDNDKKKYIKMKKEKTFNQEVEHFCRVLEAEISKKEC